MEFVTHLLTDAGDRAWSALGAKNQLWVHINMAEKNLVVGVRRKYVSNAMDYIKTIKSSLSDADYDFIYKLLSKSFLLLNSLL